MAGGCLRAHLTLPRMWVLKTAGAGDRFFSASWCVGGDGSSGAAASEQLLQGASRGDFGRYRGPHTNVKNYFPFGCHAERGCGAGDSAVR